MASFFLCLLRFRTTSKRYQLNYKGRSLNLEQQHMKTIILVTSLLVAQVYMQCQIPPNCENYSVSQQKCVSCQPNYLLISNLCISTLPSFTNIIAQPTQSQQAIVPTQSQNGKTAQVTSQSTSTVSTQPVQQSTQQFTQQTATQQSTNINPNLFYWSNNQIQTSTQPLQSQQSTQQQWSSQAFSQQQSTIGSISSSGSSGSSGGSGSSGSGSSTYDDNNCKTKDESKRYCIQCYNSFFYNTTNGKCSIVNPLCKNYTSTNLCISCYTGYSLANGNCLIDNTYGSSGSSNSITNTNSNANSNNGQSQQQSISNSYCANFTFGVCWQCYRSYYWNTTLNRCLPQNQNCKSVTATNRCTSCYTGYILNEVLGDCLIISAPATIPPTYSTPTSQTGIQYISWNGLIYQINSRNEIVGPITFPVTTPTSNLPLVNNDPYCNNLNSAGQCLGCLNRYYLSSSGCKMVDQNCQSWRSNGLCTQCQGGYTVANDGSCKLIVVVTDQTCYRRQYLLNGVCVNVSDQCNTYDQVSGVCLSCYKGYSLSNGACILS